MRFKLSESPVFKAMKAEGDIAGNPFKESFTYPGNAKRLFVAAIGCAAGMTVLFYNSAFYLLHFMKGPLRVDDTWTEILVGVGAFLGMLAFQPIGALTDRVGRRGPMLLGYILSLLLLFPAFHTIATFANPGLAEASQRAPVVVSGPDCNFSPFANDQDTPCGKLLSDLASLGVAYQLEPEATLGLTAGGKAIALDAYPWEMKAERGAALAGLLEEHGYQLGKITPDTGGMAVIIACVALLTVLTGLTYGGMAALLTEMFPARIRYSSMSIPYHFGTGYFGGFLPLIAAYIVARTGDPYSGLWYTWLVVAVALVVAWWGIAGGPPKDFADD
jgi:MFS family permease